MRFQAGQKVIVTKTNAHASTAKRGTKATILSAHSSNLDEIAEEDIIYYIQARSNSWFMPGRYLELQEQKPIYAVGDIVEITAYKPYGANLVIGQEVEITSIKPGRIRVKTPTNTWSVNESVIKPTTKIVTTKIEKTMTTIHDQILAELKLEVGDVVEITHKVPSRNLGWYNEWNPKMDVAVGKRGKVLSEPKEHGVKIEIDGMDEYYYPAQSIKFISKAPKFKEMKISKDYSAKVYADRIEVGCQTITMENFKKLQKLVAEVKK
jgi:hypothetical protein